MSEVESPELENVESESFFWENMEMVGFDTPSRALVIAVKEAVDNALDSCEDVNVLPEVRVTLEDSELDDTIILDVEDNAGGIAVDDIESVFGEVLYSSRFGSWRQTRGQQGIGISAVFLWSQKYTGRPTEIWSKKNGDAHYVKLSANRKGEELNVLEREKVELDKDHGTRIRIPIHARWNSIHYVEQYLEGTSVANPSARIVYERQGDRQVFERTDDSPPTPPEEMKPYPAAADIGMLEEMVNETNTETFGDFLEEEFCQIRNRTRGYLIDDSGFSDDRHLEFTKDEFRKLADIMRNFDYRNPTDKALSPLGDELIEQALQPYSPDFVGTQTRELKIINGHPTIIEAGLAYGGEISESTLHRIANRVPLVYDKSACLLTDSIKSVSWDRYDVDQSDTGYPIGPVVVFLHVCSTSVKFGSEAKTFVAHNEELKRQAKLALEACGRDLSTYIEQKRRRKTHKKKVEKMAEIYTALDRKLEEVTSKEGTYIDAIAQSCNTVIVDDREETSDVIRNPTDETKTIKVNGEVTEIPPTSEIEWDGSSVEYGYYPLYADDVPE